MWCTTFIRVYAYVRGLPNPVQMEQYSDNMILGLGLVKFKNRAARGYKKVITVPRVKENSV